MGPAAAFQLVGQVGVGVDVDDGDIAQVVGQAVQHAVADRVFSSQGQQEFVAMGRRQPGRGRQVVFQTSAGRKRRQGVEPRTAGEVDQRFLVEQLHLAARFQDGLGRPPGPRPIANGHFQRQGQDDDIRLVEVTGGRAEELSGFGRHGSEGRD